MGLMNLRAPAIQPIKAFAFSLPPETKGLLWIVLVSLAIMTPTLVWGIPSSRDLTNHFRFALPNPGK